VARPQKFDEKQILHKAMNYFWVHGYSASSIQELLTEMEISRGTLYNAIGDKEALFKKVLELFTENAKRLFRMTLSNPALMPEQRVEQFLKLSFIENEAMPLGCLMVNTLCEDDRAVAPFKSLSSETMRIMESSLKGCFEQIQSQREEALILGAEQAASVLATQVRGARIRQREGESNSEIMKDLMVLFKTLIKN
jgi:TetR/AcrR family transcriptional repressor of nem operon